MNIIENMTIICNIQAMERYIQDLQPHSFEVMWAMQRPELEALQAELVERYNLVVEGRRFAADMIYGRSPVEDMAQVKKETNLAMELRRFAAYIEGGGQ